MTENAIHTETQQPTENIGEVSSVNKTAENPVYWDPKDY